MVGKLGNGNHSKSLISRTQKEKHQTKKHKASKDLKYSPQLLSETQVTT